MKPRAGVPVSMFAELAGEGGGAASDAEGEGPLYRRAYLRIRRMILGGALPPGRRLPSTRTLASDLGVSRNTIEAAFSQLEVEGFITRRVGSGSYVSDSLPGAARSRRGRHGEQRGATPAPRARRSSGAAALSRRGRLSSAAAPDAAPDADATFGVCRPGLDVFPLHIWNRLLARRVRRTTRGRLDECPPAGLPELRRAVAAYLAAARGVHCDAGQVIILSSTQQALDLAGRLLLDPGDAAWIEEPCYIGARAAFRAAGARLVPVPVDDEGLDVARGRRLAPDARLAYVTPSHQFPLGVTMPVERRLALLRWAEEADSWIFEDDYDSEFRYVGRPLAAMQGLDGAGRVLYAGTFNKVMFPSLRLAYLVVPADLVDAFAAARQWVDGHNSPLVQAAVADFIDGGHFGIHLRNMRELYRERRDALCSAVAQHAGPLIRLGPVDAGMHAAGWLPADRNVRDLMTRAASRALYLRDIAVYYSGPAPAPGLVLNFASAPPAAIRRGIRLLATLI